ncbi:AMP-binding protein [Azospirillum himalayense]|uniref:AMP-binding protein n=1 Tax=Azospirillum himalayense TaxID=654847 RepID=A0ABW0GIL4_9PROT
MSSQNRIRSLPRTLHSLLEMRASERPDHPFLMASGQTWTFAELDRHASRLAHGLKRRGVGKGDHVLVMMAGSPAYLALWFAVSKLGAVEVPVNGAYRGAMLRHVLQTAQVRLAIVEDAHRAVFLEASDGLVDPAAVLDPDALFTESDEDGPFASADVAAGDPAGIIFTSGTTGPSKGVVMSHRHQMSFGLFFSEITGFRADDVAYNYLPFFHIAAKFLTLGTMLAGGRMALRPVFSLSRFWSDVHEYGVTVCVAVGGLCHLLNSAPERPTDAENPLRLIYAVPVPWEFKERFEARFGLELVEGYGGTESNLVAYSRLGEDTPRGSCGRPSDHFEVVILDEDGHEVPRGEAGEICVRPRHPRTVMTGYLGLPEKTLEAFDGCWLHTGDRAYMNEDGYVFFLDRMKDAIRRRGENISSFEVERMLNAHPDVAESAVVPVPSEVGEDEVKAIVVLREGSRLTPEALLRFAVETMPYFMVPRFVEFRAELPRTPTMKVRKVELRSEGRTDGTWDCEQAGLRITRRGLEPL